jgi:hypothetical protein
VKAGRDAVEDEVERQPDHRRRDEVLEEDEQHPCGDDRVGGELFPRQPRPWLRRRRLLDRYRDEDVRAHC